MIRPEPSAGRASTLRSGWLLLAAVGPLLLTLAPISSDDFWFHLATGRWIAAAGIVPKADVFSFTARGEPWVVHEWLWEVVIWELWRGLGPLGIIAFRVMEAGLALGGAWAAAHALGASPRTAALATSLMSLAAARRFTDRPQMLTAAAFGLLLYALERHRQSHPRLLRLAFLPLFLIWANGHAGVLYGVALMAYEAGWAAWERRWAPARELTAGFLAAIAIGVWATPAGLAGLLYPLRMVDANRVLDIDEYKPIWVFFGQASFWPMWVAMGIALLASLVGLRRDLRGSLRTLALIGSAVAHVRGVDLAALSAVPMVASALGQIRPAREVAVLSAGSAIVLLLVALWLEADPARRPGLRVDLSQEPQGAVAFLDRERVPGLGYNSYTFGGFLLFAEPQRPVFIDGRLDPYLHLLSGLRAGADPFTHWPMTYAITSYSDVGLPLVRQHLPLVWFDDLCQVAAVGYPLLELQCLLPEGPFFADGAAPAQCLTEAQRLTREAPESWRASLLLSAALLQVAKVDEASVALDRAARSPQAPPLEVLGEMRELAVALAAPDSLRAARLRSIGAQWHDASSTALGALAAGDCSGLTPALRRFFDQSNSAAAPRSPVASLLARCPDPG